MNNHFDILDTPLSGLKIIQRNLIRDGRGYLERLFCGEDLQEFIPEQGIVQINRTLTVKCGTIRGMHFQHPPYTETKFVTCLRGEVFDVGIDLRPSSPMFLQWHAEILSAANHRTLIIPEGFAHGFQTLTADCEMLYFHTAAYQASAEGGLNAQDPRLAIKWPLNISEQSERDRRHPLLTDNFPGVAL